MATQEQIWAALVRGDDVAKLGLGVVDGRLDLRGLQGPTPVVEGAQKVLGVLVQYVRNPVVLRGVTWRGLDLSRAELTSMKFMDCVIDNCVFDEATCRDWGMWGTRVTQCRFRKANLRDAALGALDGPKRNLFESVDFTSADLRGSAHTSATFRNCDFSRAKLAKVDFGGDVFEDCRFAGELSEVTFARYPFGAEDKGLPPNEMTRVDMRDASLRWVSLRGQDLGTTLLPNDDDHIVVDHAPLVLAAVTAHFSNTRWDIYFRGLESDLMGGSRTVVNRKDLLKAGGEETVRAFLAIKERVVAEANASPS